MKRIVNPTQAAVEEAESEVRFKSDINRGQKAKSFQIGVKDRGKSKSNRSSMKKKKKNVTKLGEKIKKSKSD